MRFPKNLVPLKRFPPPPLAERLPGNPVLPGSRERSAERRQGNRRRVRRPKRARASAAGAGAWPRCGAGGRAGPGCGRYTVRSEGGRAQWTPSLRAGGERRGGREGRPEGRGRPLRFSARTFGPQKAECTPPSPECRRGQLRPSPARLRGPRTESRRTATERECARRPGMGANAARGRPGGGERPGDDRNTYLII